MEFKRTIEEKIDYHFSNYNQPILVYGARQIGKTRTIKNYLKKNKLDYVYINFESNPEYIEIFEKNYDINRIIKNIKIRSGNSSFTVLFFDEIQVAQRAITALKYFAEDSTSIKVICSGSALGLTIYSEGFSFPVGKVQMLKMYPMTFFEFLDATKNTELLEEVRANVNSIELEPIIHDSALELFDEYLLIGGLPRCIEIYILENDYNSVILANKNLMLNYIHDIKKYSNPKMTLQISKIYSNISAQLEKDNQKFKFSEIEKQGYKVLATPIEWLKNSFLTIPVYKISNKKVHLPLKSHVKENEFKLLMHDTSLLINNYDYGYFRTLTFEDKIYSGVILENYVGTILATKFEELYYYHNKTTEVDYLVQFERKLYAIEIKAGKNNPSKSLKYFIESQNIDHAFKITRSNYYKSENITGIPVYAVENLFIESKL